MLLDNKTPRGANAVTVYELFQERITATGTFDAVTGYFSAAALSRIHLDFGSHFSACRLIIGDHAQTDGDVRTKAAQLFAADLGLNEAFGLSDNARSAIAFLERPEVQVRTLQPAFCHAKAYLFRAASGKSNSHFYATGSSNLTQAGLGLTASANVELNIAASGDDPQFNDLREWFEALWASPQTRTHIEVREEGGGPKRKEEFKQHLIQMLRDLSRPYQPREIYEKVLFELFYDELKAWQSGPEAEARLRDLRQTVVYRDLLPFQQRGVLSLIRMLQTYGGAILADAVGLGKTWQALAVMKYFQDQNREIILLCPKKLRHNWQKFKKGMFSRFEADEFDFVLRYHTDLTPELIEHKGEGKDDPRDLRWFQSPKPKLIVIDESHNLRNDKGSRYQFLVDHILHLAQRPNRDVKVLLLSATPINTGLLDVRNQFKLLARGQDDGFARFPDLAVPSLRYAFSKVQEVFAKWLLEPAETRRLATFTQALPKPFLDLTDRLIVARTRRNIAGMTEKLTFPTKNPPQNLYVGLDRLGGLHSFKAIFDAFRVNMTAYKPAEYVAAQKPKKGQAQLFGDEAVREGFLVKMMMVLLVKRLESSWDAFGLTVKRILDHHENALRRLDAFEAGTAPRAALAAADDDGAADPETDANELADAVAGLTEPSADGTTQPDAADLTLGRRNPIRLADLQRRADFRRDLGKDLKKLRPLYQHIQTMTAAVATETAATPPDQWADTKLARLVTEIEAKRATRPDGTVPNQKVIIFTVFHDTAAYLYRELTRRGFTRVAMVSGAGGRADDGAAGTDFEPLLQRFAPFTKLYNERDWTDRYAAWGLAPDAPRPSFDEWQTLVRQHDPATAALLDRPLDLLIATDCLSEGQNLQDADCVMSYDIHWNPVRLIQRMGRVDRLGSPNATVTGYNFWPAKSYDDYLNLKNRVENRMALLSLVGAEYDDELSPEMVALVEGIDKTSLASQQAERTLRQLQTSWDDLETNDEQLAFDSFSLEPFRQELLALLDRDQRRYRQLPPGIFSGCRALPDPAPDGRPYPAPGVVALLGYPSRPQNAPPDWQYTTKYLAFGGPDGPARFANTGTVLAALRRHAPQPRHLDAGLETGDRAAFQALRGLLDGWLAHQRAPAQAGAVVRNLLQGQPAPAAESAAAPPPTVPLEQKFQPDQFDVLCWCALDSPIA